MTLAHICLCLSGGSWFQKTYHWFHKIPIYHWFHKIALEWGLSNWGGRGQHTWDCFINFTRFIVEFTRVLMDCTRFSFSYPPPNKHSTWKWMVGILFSFWVSAYFQGRTVSFRECKLALVCAWYHDFQGSPFVGRFDLTQHECFGIVIVRVQ